MAFTKTAKVPVVPLSVAKYDTSTGTLTFAKSANKNASYYQANSERINIKQMLEMVAKEYDISPDPADYIFEAVRAVTADIPNENGDAFPKAELLRFDHRLGKAIYQTFIGKPHHINHRADNPKTSRGVVLDASYNDSGTILDSCEACGTRTAGNASVTCQKCGSPVKDEFVELLLAVDTKKDPTFAEGVKSGALDSLSMGCEAGYTDCSICDNRARSTQQFCQHIKSGNKKKHFKTANGERMSFEKCGEVVFTEISRVDQPADPKALSREILSINSLPMAQESEMLVMAARLAKVEAQMSAPVPATGQDAGMVEIASPQVPFKNIAESIKWAENSIHKLKADVHRLVADKGRKHKEAASEGRPFYAWENAAYESQIKANRQYIARLEDYVTKARDMQASGMPWEKGLTRQMSRFFANKEAQLAQQLQDQMQEQLVPLKEMHPEIAPLIDQLSGGGDVPGPMSIDDYAKKHEDLGDKKISPAEMGMKPEQGGLPAAMTAKVNEKMASQLDALVDSVKDNNMSVTASIHKFANSYKDLEASVTKSGNITIKTANGTLFVVRPTEKPADKAAAEKLVSEILTHIADHGIVNTVEKYETVIGPKMSQILEHHLEDHGEREEGDKKSITEGGIGGGQLEERESPKKSLVEKEHTDRKDEVREKRNPSNSDVLEKHQPDHKETLSKEPVNKGMAEGGDGDGQLQAREKPRKDTQKDLILDRADKKPPAAGKKEAQMGAPPPAPAPAPAGPASPAGPAPTGAGPAMAAPMQMEACACMPGQCACPPDCAKCDPTMSKCGCPCGSKMAEAPAMAPMLGGSPTPAPAAAPASPADGALAPVASEDEEMAKDAKVRKYVSRIERLYKARLKNVQDEAQSKVASAEQKVLKDVSERFLRALKLAATRQALNLEFSPLKAALCDTLTAELDLDAESVYPGMDSSTAASIIEAASASGYEAFVDSLIRRAAEFVAMPKEVQAALESDIKNLQAAPLTVQASAQPRKASKEDVRQAAVKGNMTLAPTHVHETISDDGNRDNIKSALGFTKVRRTSETLLKR